MTRDEIFEMAQRAGYNPPQFTAPSTLERFAALVVDAEREACARVCDDMVAEYPEENPDYAFCLAAQALAQNIRARGQE